MGAEATDREATPEEVTKIVALLHESIDAGGLGLSTTLSNTHSDGDGKPVASRKAGKDELIALCTAVGRARGDVHRGHRAGLPRQVHRRRDRAAGADDGRGQAVDQLEPADHRLARARPDPATARGVGPGPRAGRPDHRVDDAGPGPDEHEPAQLLRPVADPGLERRAELPGARADREAARSGGPRAHDRAGEQQGGGRLPPARGASVATSSATPTAKRTRASRAGSSATSPPSAGRRTSTR